MNPTAARNRLLKNILFDLIKETKRDICFHCKKKLSIEDFSIEHKIPWLDSKDPLKLYFDLDNISFSHFSCNSGNTSRKKYNTPEEKHAAKLKRWYAYKKTEAYKRKKRKGYIPKK